MVPRPEPSTPTSERVAEKSTELLWECQARLTKLERELAELRERLRTRALEAPRQAS